jgi:GNAT superfamily N-acetyltransferase
LIFETRAKNLTKLGEEPVLSVVTDFPLEFTRMVFKGLQQVWEIDPDVVETAVRKMGETIVGSSLSNRNPWFDSNNDNRFEFKDGKSGHDIQFELNFIGNEALWSIRISYERVLEKNRTLPIRIGRITANEMIANFVGKAKQMMTDMKPRYPRTAEGDEAVERAEKGLKKEWPQIINKLQPFAMAHYLFFGEERQEKRNVHRLFLRPSFSKHGIGSWTRHVEDALSWNDINRNWGFNDPLKDFTYSFQFEALEKALPGIWKRLRANSVLIMGGGFTGDYIWLDTSPASRSARHPSSSKKDDGGWYSYGEVEEDIEKRLDMQIQGAKEKAKSMTLEEFKRFLIINALDNVKEEK